MANRTLSATNVYFVPTRNDAALIVQRQTVRKDSTWIVHDVGVRNAAAIALWDAGADVDAAILVYVENA